jgi:8-oxo-dGTP pyrophosphatase MutT (NUDIX family)
MNEYVITYCEARSENILLILKDRPPKLAGRLNLPGGKVESTDADPEHAAMRELKEETGLDATHAEQVGRIFVKHDAVGDNAVIYCVETIVDIWQERSPRKEETEPVQWYHWRKVLTDPRLMPNLRLIIPLVHAGVSGWVIDDFASTWDESVHEVNIQIPTYH